jgi:hypothetical protein
MTTSESPDRSGPFGPGPWGIYDVVDHCWLGDNAGAYVYTDEFEVRLAATLLNERFRYFARLMPRTLEPAAFYLRDQVVPPLSAVEALEQLEARVPEAEHVG